MDAATLPLAPSLTQVLQNPFEDSLRSQREACTAAVDELRELRLTESIVARIVIPLFRSLKTQMKAVQESLPPSMPNYKYLNILAENCSEVLSVVLFTLKLGTALVTSGKVPAAQVFPLRFPPRTCIFSMHVLENKAYSVTRRPTPPFCKSVLQDLQYGFAHDVIKIPSTLSYHSNECAIHLYLGDHPHIVPLSYVFPEAIATERCSHTLVDLVHDMSLERKKEYGPLFFQLLQGLAYLEEKRVVHCDIKPPNIFISEQGCLKIADFGLSVFAGEVWSPRGTALYVAPEAFQRQCVAPSRDVWAAALTMWEVITSVSFFDMHMPTPEFSVYITTLPQEAIDSKILRMISDPKLADLLIKMLQKDPSRRISPREALNHPYFQVQ